MKRCKTAAVLIGPGTNCYEETKYAIELAGGLAEYVFFEDILGKHTYPAVSLLDYSGVYVPGGFNYGDHFGAGRVGGLLLKDVLQAFADTGRPVAGSCNGFQILMEAGLFDGPKNGESGGALVSNTSTKFHHGWVMLRAEPGSPWTEGYEGSYLWMPTAHGEGRWRRQFDPPHLQVAFRYTRNGEPTMAEPENPNGSDGAVAGLVQVNSRNRLVLGMMPHPERAVDPDHGSTSGLLVMKAFVRLMKQS